MNFLREGWLLDFVAGGVIPAAANCQLVEVLRGGSRADPSVSVRVSDGFHWCCARLTPVCMMQQSAGVPPSSLVGALLTLKVWDKAQVGGRFVLLVDEFVNRGCEGSFTFKEPRELHSEARVQAALCAASSAEISSKLSLVQQVSKQRTPYPQEAPSPLVLRNSQNWSGELHTLGQDSPALNLSLSLGEEDEEDEEEKEQQQQVDDPLSPVRLSVFLSDEDEGSPLAAFCPPSPPPTKKPKLSAFALARLAKRNNNKKN